MRYLEAISRTSVSAWNWTFGVLFLPIGLISIFKSQVAGSCLIAVSLLLLPPFRQFVYSKTNFQLRSDARVFSIFLLLVTSFIFDLHADHEEQREIEAIQAEAKIQEEALQAEEARRADIQFFHANRDHVISSINDALSAGDYRSVVAQSQRFLPAEDAALEDIVARAKVGLAKQKSERLLSDIAATSGNEFARRRHLYQQLVALNPDDATYKDKHAFYAKKDEQTKRKKAQERVFAESRKKKIEQQFSSWDGSHRNLDRFIKNAMNDPDSYEHAETVYWDKGEYLIVQTTYRGKNAFGGVVKNYIKAKIDLNGEILQVLDAT